MWTDMWTDGAVVTRLPCTASWADAIHRFETFTHRSRSQKAHRPESWPDVDRVVHPIVTESSARCEPSCGPMWAREPKPRLMWTKSRPHPSSRGLGVPSRGEMWGRFLRSDPDQVHTRCGPHQDRSRTESQSDLRGPTEESCGGVWSVPYRALM